MKFVENCGCDDSELSKGYEKLANRVPRSGDNISDTTEIRDDSGFYGPTNIPPNRMQKKSFADQG